MATHQTDWNEDYLTMRGRPTAQAACAIFTRVCRSLVRVRIAQLYTHLQVELDHGQGGARSGAGCRSPES